MLSVSHQPRPYLSSLGAWHSAGPRNISDQTIRADAKLFASDASMVGASEIVRREQESCELFSMDIRECLQSAG